MNRKRDENDDEEEEEEGEDGARGYFVSACWGSLSRGLPAPLQPIKTHASYLSVRRGDHNTLTQQQTYLYTYYYMCM